VLRTAFARSITLALGDELAQYLDRARSVIAWNPSPDVPFDRSINRYRGCEHGCIYCFARPDHARLDLSPGQDFETRLFYKADAAARLEAELRAPAYRPAPITLGANTDPYQPIEREHRVTRDVLAVLSAYRHPVSNRVRWAAISAMRRVLQDGQTPRPLHENAIRKSWPQSPQRARAKPWAKMPHSR